MIKKFDLEITCTIFFWAGMIKHGVTNWMISMHLQTYWVSLSPDPGSGSLIWPWLNQFRSYPWNPSKPYTCRKVMRELLALHSPPPKKNEKTIPKNLAFHYTTTLGDSPLKNPLKFPPPHRSLSVKVYIVLHFWLPQKLAAWKLGAWHLSQRWISGLCLSVILPQTNSSPPKIGRPKRKLHFPTIDFQVRTVSFREGL